MKRKIFLTVILIIALSLLITAYRYSDSDNEYKSYGLNESSIAIMVYDDETDSYIKQSSIPKGAKYSLNEELTNCEAGGKVTNYSKANGTLNYELKKADKCYVYFDVDNTPSYAIYSETDNSLIFYKNNDEVGKEYNGRVVTAKYDNVEDSVYTYDSNTLTPSTPWYKYASVIKTVSVANEIMPISTANWFVKLENAESINLTNLDTSQVTSMYRMFDRAGYTSESFELNLDNKFNTENVSDMYALFQCVGYLDVDFMINLGDKFDTSKVVDMGNLFSRMGYSSTKVELDLGNKFDTSNVTNMQAVFQFVGRVNPNFTLDLGDKFDTTNVTDMSAMFNEVGMSNTDFELNLGLKFDTSKVQNMEYMFRNSGYSNPNFTLNLGDKFNTSKVTNMKQMFQFAGYSNSDFELDLGSNFDTAKVTTMAYMFQYAGYSNSSFELDLSNFVVQSGCNLAYFAYNSASKIIFGEGWSNATLVSGMFKCSSSTPVEIVNAPANIQNYNFANDNRVPTFTTI